MLSAIGLEKEKIKGFLIKSNHLNEPGHKGDNPLLLVGVESVLQSQLSDLKRGGELDTA